MNISIRKGLCCPKVFMTEGFIKSKGLKRAILLFTIFLCVTGGYYLTFAKFPKIDYVHLYSHQESNTLLNYFSLQILYTNLFYIPIILTAIWYRKIIIHLAIFLGLFHIYLTYYALGFLVIGTIERVAIFVLLAYVVALISDEKAKEEMKVRRSEEDLNSAYNELKVAQDQLMQNEKMAAIGRLTSGVAHQIRNPLGIILMGVEYLDNTLSEKDEKCAESIKIIKQAVDRANKIIVDILQFSRKDELKFESVDVCELLDATINLVDHNENLKNIKINRNYPKEPIKCKADKNMLQQVVINLLSNAVDALQEGGEIKVNVFYKFASKVGNKVGKRTGDYFKIGDKIAVVEIEDTGKGIPEDLLPNIFEPFFTTKETGKGTGLGLSLAHLIIDRHRGSIEVESEVNKGSKFIINLQPENN
jgi:signal transduction histidine kinase